MSVYDGNNLTGNEDFAENDMINFDYSGISKRINLPAGRFKLECWGAEGGYRSSSTYAGKGGYSKGELSLDEDTSLYVRVGQSGRNRGSGTSVKAFNGGGLKYSYYGGGDATDIRIQIDDYNHRVIVAGGGGSDGASNKQGMYGGGESGGSTSQSYGTGGYGGTQTGVSSSSWQTSSPSTSYTTQAGAYAGFGFGGNGIYRSSGYGGAGGGGWYGGSGAYPDTSGDDDRGGGGGSGFVLNSTTVSKVPSGYALNEDYFLNNSETISGNVAFVQPDGTQATGKAGNGYVRITIMEIFAKTPRPPKDLKVVSKTYTTIEINWDLDSDANGYKIFLNNEFLASQTNNTYEFTDLLPNTEYLISVLGFNENGDGDTSEISVETEFAYYEIEPVFESAEITPLTTFISQKVNLSVSVNDELKIFAPYFYYSNEIYAGEV